MDHGHVPLEKARFSVPKRTRSKYIKFALISCSFVEKFGFPPPEMTFAQNLLTVKNGGSFSVTFDALEALAQVTQQNGGVKVQAAQNWEQHKFSSLSVFINSND